MLEFSIYLALTALNLSALCLLVRWRRLHSYEGVGTALLLLVVLADTIGTLWAVLSDTDLTRVHGRLYPTTIHLLGLTALAVGLFVVDPRPRRQEVSHALVDTNRLKDIGLAMAGLGILMKAIAIYAFGYRDLFGYINNLDQVRSRQSQIGGFFDEGSSIAVFGLCVFLARRTCGPLLHAITLAGIALVSFLLSYSRADLAGSLVIYLVVTLALNPHRLAILKRKPGISLALLALATAAILWNAGIKSQFRAKGGGFEAADMSLSTIATLGEERLVQRFSGGGLYNGYCNLVNRMSDGSFAYYGGRVGSYALTSWIPYLIYKEKPQHPFRDAGFLMYDIQQSSLSDVSAPTLVGSAYADYGILSTLVYLATYGMLLGLVKVVSLRKFRGPWGAIWYLHFVIVDGGSNFIHGGILNCLGSLALASGVTGIAYVLLVGIIQARKNRRPAGIPATWAVMGQRTSPRSQVAR